MEYFATFDTIGIRTIKDNNIIQIEFNKENDIIIINLRLINKKEFNHRLIINRQYIINNITSNFTVEMLYNILVVLIKYDNFKFNLSVEHNSYIFEGTYIEPYDQGDEIHIKIEI